MNFDLTLIYAKLTVLLAVKQAVIDPLLLGVAATESLPPAPHPPSTNTAATGSAVQNFVVFFMILSSFLR